MRTDLCLNIMTNMESRIRQRETQSFLLICTTLTKILVIAAVFMHLRYERINLIPVTFAPLWVGRHYGM